MIYLLNILGIFTMRWFVPISAMCVKALNQIWDHPIFNGGRLYFFQPFSVVYIQKDNLLKCQICHPQIRPYASVMADERK